MTEEALITLLESLLPYLEHAAAKNLPDAEYYLELVTRMVS